MKNLFARLLGASALAAASFATPALADSQVSVSSTVQGQATVVYGGAGFNVDAFGGGGSGSFSGNTSLTTNSSVGSSVGGEYGTTGGYASGGSFAVESGFGGFASTNTGSTTGASAMAVNGSSSAVASQYNNAIANLGF